MIIATDPEPLRGSFYVKFYPALENLFGSKHVPLIIGRLEYWFKNKKFTKGFFKFLEPCPHYLYKPGDSWQEEANICRKTFNAAFSLIGVSYSSKSAFLAEDDPFKGKLYARYYDRKANQMFFVRNHAFAEEFFKDLFKRKDYSDGSSKPTNQATINEPRNEGEEGQKFRSWNRKNSRSHEVAYIDKQKTTNKSSLELCPQSTTEPLLENVKPEEEMKKIWQEEIGNRPRSTTSSSFAKRLRETLHTHFENSLEKWRDYCAKIASSKFLMGEKPNTKFKAWLEWAVKSEVIERIRADGFTFGDREKPRVVIDHTGDCQQNILHQPDEASRLFHAFIWEKYGNLIYYNWFRKVKLEMLEGQQLKILVPSFLHQERIETYYSVFLTDAVCLAFKRQCAYKVVVEKS